MQLDAKCRQIIKKLELEKKELLSNEKINEYISILHAWFKSAHPDKMGGDVDLFKKAFDCVRNLRDILRERRESGNYRGVFVDETGYAEQAFFKRAREEQQKRRAEQQKRREELRKKREEEELFKRAREELQKRRDELLKKRAERRKPEKKKESRSKLERETKALLEKLATCMKNAGFELSDVEIKSLYV